MQRPLLTLTSLTTVVALFFPCCADLPPGQRGPFSDGAAAGSQFAQAPTRQSAENLATGGQSGAAAYAAIVVLDKRPATQRQRTVAVARAKVIVQRLKKKQAQTAAAEPKPRAKKPEVKTADAPEKKTPTAKAADLGKAKPAAKKIPRYIAVDTVKDERTVPAAQKTVIIFDTETEEIVGNNVYDIKTAPPAGTVGKFETYTAEYVGGGGGG